MSNGKPTIVIAEMQPSPFDPQSQQRMTEFAQKKGITNGQLTKEQFTEYMQEQMTRIRAMMPGGGGPAPAPAPTIDENALRNEFRELDKNRDGVLSGDEIPADLKANLEKWDTNKDKQIQFDEYKEYYKSKTQPTQPASQPVVDPLQEEDKRSVVYDAKHLPKELTQFAPWFAQLDTDHDGQVALYEWKAAGRDINEFYTYDTNRDGLITVEEVLRYLKKQKPEAFAATATPEGSPSAGGGFGGGPRMPGGFGPPGGGMGGPTMPGGNGNWGGPGGGRGKGPGGGGRGPGGGDAAGPSGGGQKDVKRDRDMNGGGKGKIKQIQP